MKKLFIHLALLVCVVILSSPSFTLAFEFLRTERTQNIEERIAARMGGSLERICNRLAGNPNATLPAFCEEPPPPPPVDICPNVPGNQATGPCADQECTEDGGTWNGTSCDMPPPPPVDVCPNVPGVQENGPCADEECVEDGGTWNGTSCDMPPPEEPTLAFSADPTSITEGQSSTLNWNSEHTDTCTASSGWSGTKGTSGLEVVSPLATTTYELECTGDGGTISEEVTVTVTPAPVVMIGHVVVSEVLYDVNAAHGVNTGSGNNEWIELYNGSDETVDLSGWKLVDNGTDVETLPDGTMLAPDEFLIITATSTTAGFWDIPDGVEVIVLGEIIGNGLAAGGDVVTLLNADDTAIDAVSWGTNTTAFNPSVTGVAQGHSIERAALEADSDTADDWEDHTNPTPGTSPVPTPSSL